MGQDVEIVLTRTVTADGKGGRARINGRLVTVAVLAAVGAQLVEIAGQQEAQGVGTPTRQRALLDAFSGSTALAAELAHTVRAASPGPKRVGRRWCPASASANASSTFCATRSPRSRRPRSRRGSLHRLTADADRLEHAESIALALGRAIDALNGDDGAAETVDSALRDVTAAARRDPILEEVARRLEAASLEISDVAGDLTRSMVAPDPRSAAGDEGPSRCHRTDGPQVRRRPGFDRGVRRVPEGTRSRLPATRSGPGG